MKRLAVKHDADAVADGGDDVLPLSVANADKEFFKRAPYFDPRVSPSSNAIDALAVAHMLDDVLGVAQRKVELVALHGEYAAVARG